jgi:hypothetical protein
MHETNKKIPSYSPFKDLFLEPPGVLPRKSPQVSTTLSWYVCVCVCVSGCLCAHRSLHLNQILSGSPSFFSIAQPQDEEYPQHQPCTNLGIYSTMNVL